METLRQIRVVFVGIPDVGKSTLISAIIERLYGKIVSPDTLMNELEYSNGKDIYGNADTRTIKAAKIIVPYKNYEIMLIDAPGHTEYKEQIVSSIEMASIVVCLVDVNRLTESINYLEQNIMPYVADKLCLRVNTHTSDNTERNFSTLHDGAYKAIDYLVKQIDEFCHNFKGALVDVEEEAKRIVSNVMQGFHTPVLMFSGGKDSIVGYDLLKGFVKNVVFPYSGFDFEELKNFIFTNYDFVQTMNNLPKGVTYDNSSVFDIHLYKGEFNNLIEQEHDLVCINYRASDEGVRSKDHYLKKGSTAYRFSPVFYFSEENIWRYIAKHSLRYCDLYHKGYRSLGDYPVTVPCMPSMSSIEEIIEYVHNNPFEERNGRTGQDNAQKYAMEKLRNAGFF